MWNWVSLYTSYKQWKLESFLKICKFGLILYNIGPMLVRSWRQLAHVKCLGYLTHLDISWEVIYPWWTIPEHRYSYWLSPSWDIICYSEFEWVKAMRQYCQLQLHSLVSIFVTILFYMTWNIGTFMLHWSCVFLTNNSNFMSYSHMMKMQFYITFTEIVSFNIMLFQHVMPTFHHSNSSIILWLKAPVGDCHFYGQKIISEYII